MKFRLRLAALMAVVASAVSAGAVVATENIYPMGRGHMRKWKGRSGGLAIATLIAGVTTLVSPTSAYASVPTTAPAVVASDVKAAALVERDLYTSPFGCQLAGALGVAQGNWDSWGCKPSIWPPGWRLVTNR